MKQRSQSAVAIALVGLLPAILGGPVWSVVATLLFMIGYAEYQTLAKRISPSVKPFGYAVVPAFSAATYIDRLDLALLGAVSLAIALPMAETTLRPSLDGAYTDWALAAAGALYLGVPLFASIQLREMAGAVDKAWIADLTNAAALGWDEYPRGLAWLIAVILITWMSDTFAYLVGKQFGHRKLSPVVSPNKTVEGLVGGLAGAAVTGALTLYVFGLDDSIWIGALAGLALSIVGLSGDLAESMLKRRAGVKDSGSFIPGHGGMLDRLDALLYTFVAGLFVAELIDHYVL